MHENEERNASPWRKLVRRVPLSFVSGWLVGMLSPIVAFIGLATAVYLFTGKVPALEQEARDESGTWRLSVKLMAPRDALATLAWHRDQFSAVKKRVMKARREQRRAEARVRQRQEV